MNKDSQGEIVKTLDRLRIFASKDNPQQMISPFYHAADNLLKYGQSEKDVKKKQFYFAQFYAMFEQFAKSDFSKLKKHHEQILDEIAEIIQSETFIECLRPDLHNIRHLRSSLKIQKTQALNIQQELKNDTILTKKSSFGRSPNSSYVEEFDAELKSNQSINQGQNSESLNNLYKSLKKSYQEHCLDDSFQKMQQYLSMVADPNKISKEKSSFLKTVADQYETMNEFYSQFEKGQWIHDKQENGTTLEYKVDQIQDMIAIRIIGEAEIPIEPFLAIISQIDLMGQYVPFCYDCKQLKKISRNERIGTSKIYVPFLSDRQTFFYAAGYDRIKSNNSLFFFSKTINEDQVYQKRYNFKVPEQGKYVRLEYKFFIIEYIPLNNKRARIRLASKIDMKMNFIPKFIIFKSARIFAFDYFKNMIDRIKNFKGSPWEKKIEQNPDLYKFFHKKLDQHIFK